MKVENLTEQQLKQLSEVDLPMFNKPKMVEREKAKSVPYFLSDQALAAVMLTLQKSMLELSDATEIFKTLEFVPAPNGKLYCQNPPSFKVTPEMEAEMKKKFLDRMKKGSE